MLMVARVVELEGKEVEVGLEGLELEGGASRGASGLDKMPV